MARGGYSPIDAAKVIVRSQAVELKSAAVDEAEMTGVSLAPPPPAQIPAPPPPPPPTTQQYRVLNRCVLRIHHGMTVLAAGSIVSTDTHDLGLLRQQGVQLEKI
jgi:hypothetical protein